MNQERDQFEEIGDDTPPPLWIAPRPLAICGILWVSLGVMLITIGGGLFLTLNTGLASGNHFLDSLLLFICTVGLGFSIQGFRLVFGRLEALEGVAFLSIIVGASIFLIGIAVISFIANSEGGKADLWKGVGFGILIAIIGILFIVAGWLGLNEQQRYVK